MRRNDDSLRMLVERMSVLALIFGLIALYTAAIPRQLQRTAMTENFAVAAPLKLERHVGYAITGEWNADVTPFAGDKEKSLHAACAGAGDRIRCQLLKAGEPVAELDWKPVATPATVSWICAGSGRDPALIDAALWFDVCRWRPETP